jgi:hypothetical protein
MPRVARFGVALTFVPRALALALCTWGLLAFGAPTQARAAWWVEVQIARDDVQVRLLPSGEAEIQHRIHLNVAGGPLYKLELQGVDPDAKIEPDAYAATLQEAKNNSLASAVPVHAKLREGTSDGEDAGESSIELTIDEGNGIARGAWLIQLRYRTNLAARGGIRPDGALTHVEWTGARWPDGLDATRATFLIPTAPTPPRADDPSRHEPDDAAEIPPTFLSSLRRSREHDELELMRPYAPRGERVVWKLSVDRRALDPLPSKPAAAPAGLDVPAAAPGPDPATVTLLGEARPSVLFGAALAVFILFGLLVSLKMWAARRAARAAGAIARPVIPMPVWARAPLAAAALVSGVALQLSMKEGTWGSALVGLSAVLAAHRSPLWNPRPLRGPGRWLVVAPREVFGEPARAEGGHLDASTRAGKLWLLGIVMLFAGVAVAVSRVSTYFCSLIALDVVVFLSIFLTGMRSQLPPDLAVAPAPLLERVARRIGRTLRDGVKVAPRIRVPDGRPDADELRLLVQPKRAVEGLIGIEIGVVFVPGLSKALAFPEILVRARTGSPCEAIVQSMRQRGRIVRGRRPDELVLAVSPRWPGAKTTAALASALVTRLSAPEAARDLPVAAKQAA